MEDLNKILSSCEDKMQKVISHLKKELSKIRAGKASPSMLDSVMVEYYGSAAPISQIANVSTTDSKTITIQPWEKSMLQVIEKTIRDSDLGFNPLNNGEMLIINVPPLTEERRKILSKQAKTEVENSKISIRNIRKDGNGEAKKLKDKGISEDLIKDNENNIQKLTDKYINISDSIFHEKEKEIMTV